MIWEIISSLKNKILSVGTAGPLSLQIKNFINLKNKILEKKYFKFYSKNIQNGTGTFFDTKNINKFHKNMGTDTWVEKYFISISWNKSDKFVENKWINWKNNSSERIISVKRKFEINKNFDESFEFLYKKFWSDIPKNDLKRILWFWENNSILQIYTKNLDLLFVKYISNWNNKKINLNFKKWKQWWKDGGKNVFEIKLPILKRWEKQEIFFNFRKN